MISEQEETKNQPIISQIMTSKPQQQSGLDEEIKSSDINQNQKIVDEKKDPKKDKPTPQVPFLKGISHSEVKLSYKLQKKLSTIPRKTLNRRYKKLQELIDGDYDYFEEDQIRTREPILYFLYVGRYERNEDDIEKRELQDLLLEQMQINDWKDDLIEQLKESGYMEQVDLDETHRLSKEEYINNVDEMMRFMHDRFVAGLDPHAKYEEIDDNEELDDLQQVTQDAEDAYFDGEDPENNDQVQNEESEYTGVQDY